MKRTRYLLIALLAMMVQMAGASPVSPETAKQVGTRFLNENTSMKGLPSENLQLVTTYRTENGTAAFFVFNAAKGFVIVSADDCAIPILGYSDEGVFTIDDVPVQMEAYLQQLVKQIQYGINNNLVADEYTARQWELVRTTGFITDERGTSAVAPLLTDSWGQGCFYNNKCPSDANGPCGHVLTGCVATSFSQILHYWGYPATGTGSHTYTPLGYPQQTANFGATTYQWNNMPNSLSGSSTTTQVDAVATLMWHCGVAVEMNYGTQGSSASSADILPALLNYFNYSSDASIIYRSNYNSSQWLTLVKNCLDLGRPVHYRGTDDNGGGGHAFVCDGYDNNNYLHFNWGWYGNCNNYFADGALNPDTYAFNTGNAAIINIHPNLPSYQVTISPNPSSAGSVSFSNKGDRETITYDFESNSMSGWTTIDADGDGQSWDLGTTVMGVGYGHNASSDMVLSKSYDNTIGALHPDNYLVSPAKAIYGSISFYACAQDNAWPSEHFGVAVSTTTATAAAFTTIQEWTMSAKGEGIPAPGRGGDRTQGNWYQYTVDLSAYSGQPVWIAIRHFNCSDFFYLDVDDITLTTGGGGGGNSISAFFEQGQTCTVTATPNSGYYFANWTENGNVVSSSANYSFTVNDARNLVANFTTQPAPQQYTISISASPSNGGTVAFGNKGDRETVNYDFDDGTMMNWTSIDADGDGNGWVSSSSPGIYHNSGVNLSGTGHNASEAYVISGSYANQTSQALTPNNFLVSPTKAAYTQISFYACAQDNNYPAEHFGVAVSTTGNTNASSFTTIQEWTLTAKSSGNMSMGREGQTRAQGNWYQFTVDLGAYAGQDIWVAIRHFNCTDQFILNIDDITLTTSGSGAPVSAVYTEGQTCTVVASPNSGYTFTGWKENGTTVSTNANYSFTVTGNRNLVANFTASQPQQYTVTVSANPSNGGSVNGGGTYNQGASCTVTATPNTGYTFSSWTENGLLVSNSASYTFTVNGNHNLVANFTATPPPPQQYTVTVSANPSNGGSVSGGGTYNQGASCTVTAAPNTGYTFNNWTENGTAVSTNANYSFTVTGNHNLVANFTPIPSYTITATADPTSGGNVSGGGSYLEGTICTLTATPNTGFVFINWTKNGTAVSTNATFSFNVTENASYIAHFVTQTYNFTITATADPSEGGTVSGGGTYQQGAVCTLTATPNTGYQFVNWTQNGTVVSTSSTFSFNVTENAAFVAHFTLLSYTITVTADPTEGGVVTGGGTYHHGDVATITVIPNANYEFLNWTENGQTVSEDLSYSFTVTSNRQLVAHLSFVDDVEEQGALSVSVFPNPANDKLYIECEQHILRYELLTLTGSQLGGYDVDAAKLEIPLNSLPSGVYLLRLTTAEQVLSRRIIKE